MGFFVENIVFRFGNWQKVDPSVMCTLICYEMWLSKSQIWSQILQVGVVPLICPIFPALRGCGQVSVLPACPGAVVFGPYWHAHCSMSGEALVEPLEPLSVQMLKENESSRTTNRGINSVLAQHAAPSPLKWYIAVSLQVSKWGDPHNQVHKAFVELKKKNLWDAPSTPQTGIPHLLWKRHVAL